MLAGRGMRGKAHKLSRAEEYRAVLAASCRLSGKNFVVKALASYWPRARMGLIVSRKTASRAVDRNRCKRIAREAFRKVRAELPALDILVQPKNDLRTKQNRAIRQELDQLLRDVAAKSGRDQSGRRMSRLEASAL